MRQPMLPTTAPLDPDPKWPDGQIEASGGRAEAHEKNIPYCVLSVQGVYSQSAPGVKFLKVLARAAMLIERCE